VGRFYGPVDEIVSFSPHLSALEVGPCEDTMRVRNPVVVRIRCNLRCVLRRIHTGGISMQWKKGFSRKELFGIYCCEVRWRRVRESNDES
jgi:hypothetical protein